MKKAFLFLSSLTLALIPSLQSEPKVVSKIKRPLLAGDTSYTQVCINGNLYKNNWNPVNVLPPGFHGNYPDEGSYEIGGHAGDSKDIEVPLLSTTSGEQYVMASISFETSLMQFDLNTRVKRLGYEIEIIKEDGSKVHHLYRDTADRINDLFYSVNQVYGSANNDQEGEAKGYKFKAYYPSNALYLLFWLRKGERLHYVRFFYADLPMKVKNASLSYLTNPITDGIEGLYQGNDCSLSMYSRQVDTSLVYKMNVQVGKKLSKSYLCSKFLAKDIFDGTNQHIDTIEDIDGYFTTGEDAVLGAIYHVNLIAKDTTGNKTTLQLELHVVDTEGPLILAKESDVIKVSYETDFNSQDFVSQYFDVTDNAMGVLDYQIKLADNTDLPLNSIGDFKAKFIALDTSNNQSEYLFDLSLFDDVPPVIETQADEINLSPTKIVSSDYLKSLFKAYDAIDGEVDLQVTENTYSSNARKIGTYKYSVYCKDNSGNSTGKTLTINVADTEGPVFYAKENFMTVLEGEIPSLEEIVTSLVRRQVIEDKNYVSIKVEEGEEITNELTLGEHHFSLLLTADDQSEQRVDLTLNVVKKETIQTNTEEALQEEEIEVNGKMTWWQRIVAWFKMIFAKIKAFFHKLFHQDE